VRKQNGVGWRSFVRRIVEQTWYFRQDPRIEKLTDAFASQRLGVEWFPLGVHQGHSYVDDDPMGTTSHFDTVAADFMSTTVNCNLHQTLFVFVRLFS
jgi:hypothetical protein